MENSLKLSKFYLKRTWLSSLVWTTILLFLTIFVAVMFTNLYGTPEDRIGMAETMQNPAMVAMVGPIFDVDNYTNGAMYAQMMLIFIIITLAIMNIFLVVKLTRGDEESSRLEVVRSLPVGRLSNLLSTMIVVIITNIVIAFLIAFSLSILRIESMDVVGSILFASSVGLSGIFFGSIAALFSGVSSTSRGAVTISCIFLGIAYLVRGIGDVSVEFLSYISPLGIPLRTQVFVNNYWWPLAILLVFTVIVTMIAFYVNSIRDLGAGLIAAKPGRSEASKWLQTPMGLTTRLLKPVLIGWGITLLLMGISYGAVFGDIENFLYGSEMMQQIFLNNDRFTISEQFMTTLMAISSIVATIATLLVILKIRSEEKKERLENLYSKKVSKNKVLSSYVILSVISSMLFMFLFAFGLWIASSNVMEEPIAFMTMFFGAMVYLPAIWVMIGITLLLIAYLPKRTGFIWGFLGISFFTVYIGALVNLPNWFLILIPYTSIPRVPVEEFSIIPLIVLTIIAIVMFAAGFIGYKNRDIKK